MLRIRTMAAVTLALAAFWVQANPAGGSVAAGSATITESGSELTVDQHSDRAVINWQSFNIGSGEHTRFIQPRRSSIALNRVQGNDMSRIFGRLSATGNVFLVNPNGVIFGRGAEIDVNGLLATTSDIRDEDFMAGDFAFGIAGQPGAGIVNEGTITAAEGGLVALVAPWVRNDGLIQAHLGRATLAGGVETFTLDLYGDELVQLAVPAALTEQMAVANNGTVAADGGTAYLTAATAGDALDAVVNMTGIVQANRVEEQNGAIVLAGPKVQVDGRVEAAGGAVDIRGNDVLVTTGATIAAPDGDVMVYGERMAVLNGAVESPGASVELSSPGRVAWHGTIIADSFLIDPTDVHIVGLGFDTEDLTDVDEIGDADLGDGQTALSVSAIRNAVSDVIIQASNDIFLEITIYIMNQYVDVTLNAGRDIIMSGDINGWDSNLTLNAGNAVRLTKDMLSLSTAGGDLTINGDLHLEGPPGSSFRLETEGGSVDINGDIVGLGQTLKILAVDWADWETGDVWLRGDTTVENLYVDGVRDFTNEGTATIGNEFTIDLAEGDVDVGNTTMTGFVSGYVQGYLSGYVVTVRVFGFFVGGDLAFLDISVVDVNVDLTGDLEVDNHGVPPTGEITGDVDGDVTGNGSDTFTGGDPPPGDDDDDDDPPPGDDDDDDDPPPGDDDDDDDPPPGDDDDDDWDPDDAGDDGQDQVPSPGDYTIIVPDDDGDSPGDNGSGTDGNDDDDPDDTLEVPDDDPEKAERMRKILADSMDLLQRDLDWLDPNDIALVQRRLAEMSRIEDLLRMQRIYIAQWQLQNYELQDKIKEESLAASAAAAKDLALILLKNARRVKNIADKIKDPKKREAVLNFLNKPKVQQALGQIEEGAETVGEVDTRANQIADSLTGEMGVADGLLELAGEIPVIGDYVGLMQQYAQAADLWTRTAGTVMNQQAIDDLKGQLEQQEARFEADKQHWDQVKARLESVASVARMVAGTKDYSNDPAQKAAAEQLLQQSLDTLEASGLPEMQELADRIRNQGRI